MSIVPPTRMTKDEEARMLEELLSPCTTRDTAKPVPGGICKTTKGYLFQNIEYAQGKTGHVELLGLTSDSEENLLKKQYTEWIASTDVRIPSTRTWYQLLHRLYTNRNMPRVRTVVAECLESIREDFQKYWVCNSTGVIYNGAQGIITHNDGSQPKPRVIPEFTPGSTTNCWTYLELASEQPVRDLGIVNPIPKNAHPMLEALFGPGYEEAGAVFQYADNPMNNQNLRRVMFCTPTAKERAEHPQRSVWFRIDADGFNINTLGRVDTAWHAHAMVVREKYRGK